MILDYSNKCPVCGGIRSGGRDRKLHKQCGRLMQSCRLVVESRGELAEVEIISQTVEMARKKLAQSIA